jgi:hypothetical protein
VFVLVLVGVTSVAMYLVGVKAWGWRDGELRAAVRRTLVCLGMTLVFFLANLALGVLVVLVGRWILAGFVSLYPASDVTLVVLSWLQAMTFQSWREFARRRVEPGG